MDTNDHSRRGVMSESRARLCFDRRHLVAQVMFPPARSVDAQQWRVPSVTLPPASDVHPPIHQ